MLPTCENAVVKLLPNSQLSQSYCYSFPQHHFQQYQQLLRRHHHHLESHQWSLQRVSDCEWQGHDRTRNIHQVVTKWATPLHKSSPPKRCQPTCRQVALLGGQLKANSTLVLLQTRRGWAWVWVWRWGRDPPICLRAIGRFHRGHIQKWSTSPQSHE